MINGLGRPTDMIAMLHADYFAKRENGRATGGGMSATGYTFEQAVEKIVYREESIASATNNVPSYLWWHLAIDEEGTIAPKIDLGKLPSCRINERRWRFVFPKEVMDNDGPWRVVLNEEVKTWGQDRRTELDILLHRGISFGQRFVSRVVGSWSEDYSGESDMDWNAEIIYASAPGEIIIPVSFENFACPASFKGMSVQ